MKPTKTAKITKKARKSAAQERISPASGVYAGKRAKTGNSLGFRFERQLFRAHPEFNSDVSAHVIAPGRMLVIAEVNERAHAERFDDPVLGAFLNLLARDIEQHPETIKPLDEKRASELKVLLRDVKTHRDEDLGEEALI